MKKRICLSFCFSLFFCLFFSSSLFCGKLSWVVYENEIIKWYKSTDLGTVIYSTKKGLYSVDDDSGRYIWRHEDLKNVEEYQIEIIPLTPLMLLNRGGGKKGKLIALNIQDGSILWENEEIKNPGCGTYLNPLKGEILYFAYYKIDKPSRWIPRPVGFSSFKAYIQPALYILDMLSGTIKTKKEPFFAESINVFEHADPSGTKLYSPSPSFSYVYQQPIFDSDAAYCAFPKPCKVDLNTGEILWWCKDENVNRTEILLGMPQMIADENTLYVPSGNILYALNKSDGSVKWMIQAIDYNVAGLYEDGDVFYIKGGDNKGNGYINAVNRKNGSFIWESPFRYNYSTNLIVQKDNLFLFSDKNIFSVNKADGKMLKEHTVIEVKEFNESVSSLLMRPDGLVLKGTQHVAMVDTSTGQEKWHKYLKPPEIPAWIIVSNIAISVALSSLSYYSASSIAAPGSTFTYPVFFPNLKRKYASTSSIGLNHMYILTKLEKGPGVAAVNLDTGEVSSEVLLDWKIGQENLYYRIDELGYKVYQTKEGSLGGTNLLGYSF